MRRQRSHTARKDVCVRNLQLLVDEAHEVIGSMLKAIEVDCDMNPDTKETFAAFIRKHGKEDEKARLEQLLARK